MSWIEIPNWERFQHYGLYRRPLWIKNYTMLLHKDDYLDLPVGARGLLHGIWLAYADRDGLLRTSDLNAILKSQTRASTLESLNHAGLLLLSASKPLPLSTKEELPPQKPGHPANIKVAAAKKRDHLHQQLLERAHQVAATWNGGGSDVFDDALSRLEHEHSSHLKSSEREQLWDQVLEHQRKG
jgi:hypothetical protein